MGKKSAPKSYDINAVRAAASKRWPEILSSVCGLPRETFEGKNHRPCPWCGGTDRFRPFDDDSGGCHCNQCFNEKNGDGFATVQKSLACDFGKALRSVADYLGIQPSLNGNGSHKESSDPAEHLVFQEWNKGHQIHLESVGLIAQKPGISLEAIKRCGGLPATYRNQYQVVALPVYGPELLDQPPVGWCLYNRTGGPLPIYKPGGEIEWKKIKLTKGSKPGLIGQVAAFVAARSVPAVENASDDPNAENPNEPTIWKCEGPSDVLAGMTAAITQDAMLADGVINDTAPAAPHHIFITNANGCGEKPQPWMLSILAGRRVNTIHDADKPGQDGAARWSTAIASTAFESRNVKLPYPIVPDHGPDLRDYFARDNHTLADLIDLADAASLVESAEASKAAASSNKPEIMVDTDEHRVAKEAIDALTKDATIFQRSGFLTWIIRASSSSNDFKRPEGCPVIASMPTPIVREKMAENIAWMIEKETKDGWSKVKVHPPAFAVNAIANRGWWPGIRFLDSVVESPVFRPDGTILCEPGYDEATSLYYEPTCDFPEIPDNPTLDDAKAAAEFLFEAVCDFPFEEPCYRSAWLASVLTPFARPAYGGPTPLFLVEANQPGSGKGLLCNVISQIVAGRQFTVTPYSQDDEEMRKKITAAAISADRMILLDNVSGSIGGPSLDAALTSDTWSDRVLGKSERIKDVPLKAIWYATANNVSLKGDIARRICKIRLQSQTDRPEARRDFRHENLAEWIGANRGELVAACLTILRAYWVAGRPKMECDPWGSYYGWSDAVRQPILWLGLDDPGAKRAELMSYGNMEVTTERELLAELKTIAGSERDAKTCDQILRELILDGNITDPEHRKLENLRGLVIEFCYSKTGGLPSRVSLGKRLQKIIDRVYDGGISLKCKKTLNVTSYWVVSWGCMEINGDVNPTLYARDNNTYTHIRINSSAASDAHNPMQPHASPCDQKSDGNEKCDHELYEHEMFGGWLRTECKKCKVVIPPDRKIGNFSQPNERLGF